MKNASLLSDALGLESVRLVSIPSKVVDPELTIIVVTYNHGHYLDECLRSIAECKIDADFEILIADDDSSDGTQNVIAQWNVHFGARIGQLKGRRENNISLNGRPSGTFNWLSALHSARGRYVSVIEGDDYYLGTDAMQLRLDALRTGKYSAVWGRAVSEELSEEKFESEEIKQQALMFWSGRVMNTCGLMYRNDDLDARDVVPFTKCMNQDVILFHALLAGGKQGLLMSEVTSFYRLHEESMWSSADMEMKRIELIKTAFMLAGHYAWDDNLPEPDYDRKWLRWVMTLEESSWRSDLAQIKSGFRGLLNRVKGKFKR